MARYDHLQLIRLPERLERRKSGGGGPPPARDIAVHSTRLRAELDAAVLVQRARRRPEFVDPALILRVQMTGQLLEEQWVQLGLTVLSNDADKTLVLFASNDEMQGFRTRLDAWQGGAPQGQRSPPYNAFISSVESIGAIEPKDRIGIRFREDGFAVPEDFQDGVTYSSDIELWDLGDRRLRQRKLDEISAYVRSRGGEIFDHYLGPSISMLRVSVTGALLQTLLTVESIATIDRLPQPDFSTANALGLTLEGVPQLNTVSADTPVIGIIDSGINEHPFFEGAIVGAIGVPPELGTADILGHGTRVAGIATFGDLHGQLANGTLDRVARLCSAKVLNDQGDFDTHRLIPSQMREAMTTLNSQYGCRIFVIALGDRNRPYDGGKVGPWAATLDELARELNILIIVSSGNRTPRSGNRLEQAVTEYPDYLLEPANRFYEPAGALNALSVGAIAHGEGLNEATAGEVTVRPITREGEPSPFSRAGPGMGNSTKPDLVEIGGTIVFDPVIRSLRGGKELPSAGVLTLHHDYLTRLFTAGSGTSYAAPRVAFSAAQILARFPDASANLLRALLVGSAEVPDASRERLEILGEDAVRSVCGHGQVDIERAAFSDDARVVLYGEDELAVDHFAVYQIPVPLPFQNERGKRQIRVTLAYDPPVRHTRNDYAGLGMSFRLIRGCEPDLIFEHYRKRNSADGPFPEIANKHDCKLTPGPQLREKATVQSAKVTFSRSVEEYGDNYYLVVRCESGWAADLNSQRFAVVVEISHSAEVQLYERIRQRIRVEI